MPDNYQSFIIALLSEIIGTLSGFGSSSCSFPLASLFLILKCAGDHCHYSTCSAICRRCFIQGTESSATSPQKMGISAVLMVILGAWLPRFIAIGSLELLWTSCSWRWRFWWSHSTENLSNQIGTCLYLGVLSQDFLAGLAGTGGQSEVWHWQLQFAKDIFAELGTDWSWLLIWAEVFISTSIISIFRCNMFRWLRSLLMVIRFAGTWLGRWILKLHQRKALRLCGAANSNRYGALRKCASPESRRIWMKLKFRRITVFCFIEYDKKNRRYVTS